MTTFDEVVRLIRSEKPPLACRVVEMRDDEVVRSARVLFDGLEGWLIEDDERRELRTAEDCVLFDGGARLERFGPGLGAHSNGWVKTPIQGWRMNLDSVTGRVIATEQVDGRRTVVIEAHGLRSGEDTVFHLHVDLETGVVLRMSRPDLGTVLRVEGLRIGTVTTHP